MHPVRYFCTYFDRVYLSRALALYESLKKHCPNFKMWALCLDEAAYQSLKELALPEIEPVSLVDFERGDTELLAAKSNRSKVEYYFTCTPSFILYVLRQNPDVDLITYLDADLYFFHDVAPLYLEFGSNSIGIIAHRFPPSHRDSEKYGIYNVGYLMFRRDVRSLGCLQWWRERCNEWCYDRIEPQRFGDQKYLDDWPERFPGTIVLEHPGANVAPWNVEGCDIRHNVDGVKIGGAPLIFYHFQGLRQVGHWLFDHNLDGYGVRPTRQLIDHIYLPYIKMLQRSPSAALVERGRPPRQGTTQFFYLMGRLKVAAQRLAQGCYLIVWNGTMLSAGSIARD